MPPKQDLTAYRVAIELRSSSGSTGAEILAFLQEQGVNISMSTLRRTLAQWGVTRITRTVPEQRVGLAERIHELMWAQAPLTDVKMAEILRLDGYIVGARAVQRIRLAMGDKKRLPRADWQAYNESVASILLEEYEDGRIQDYGAVFLTQFMRQKHRVVGR